MDVSIDINHPEATYTNGETISGSIVIYCLHNVTVSKITATLIGESKSVLTRTAGLLMNREEEEVHTFVNVPKVVFPIRHAAEDSKQEIAKLGFGYHSFNFGLKVPWFPECNTCPHNSPALQVELDKNEPRSHHSRVLPPSMRDDVPGAKVSYRIEVEVTTKRNMFKFTSRKKLDINIWPIDMQAQNRRHTSQSSFSCRKSTQASILGPITSLSPDQDAADVYLYSKINTPIQIEITATFLPDFNLTQGRKIAMNLAVEKLNAHAHDLYLQSFQLLLVGYTNIRAGVKKNGEMSCWTIQSLSNIGMKIFLGSDEDDGEEEGGGVRAEHHIDARLWNQKPLPESVVPTFSTCNFERRYELEVLMGFQCRGVNDQTGRVIFVQLRIPVRISSGIFPGRQIQSSRAGNSEQDLLVTLEDNLLLDDSMRAEVGETGQESRRKELMRLYPTPPTYDEAMRVSVNKGLEEEKNLGRGRW